MDRRQKKYIPTELNEKNKPVINVQFRIYPMRTGSVNRFPLLSENSPLIRLIDKEQNLSAPKSDPSNMQKIRS